MRIGRSDANLLLSKWLADKSMLLCEGSFSKFAFSLHGHISLIDDQELKIISSDRLSELVLRFTPEMEFGYGDSRNASEDEKRYGSCLILFFGPMSEQGVTDTIAIGAIEQP